MGKKILEVIQCMNDLRKDLNFGDKEGITQEQLSRIEKEYKDYKDQIRPREKEENFEIVDIEGNSKRLVAPRWLCHVLALRHISAHVLLKWKDFWVFQVRNWNKSDSPGRLDISVGGHVKASQSIEKTVYAEMEEELGIQRAYLKGKEVLYCGSYKSYNERSDDNFYNAEWRDIFIGEISIECLENLRFKDKEVVGIYLCPEKEAENLLNQKVIPIASGLEGSMKRVLKIDKWDKTPSGRL